VIDRHSALVAAAALTTEETEVDAAAATRLATDAAADLDPVQVRTERLSSGGLDAGSPYSYPAAANLVLFTFINTLAVAGVIVEGRRLGVTRRILAGPASPGTVVAGYAASRFVVALFQGALVVVAGALLFGVRWGDPLAAAALVVAFSVVAAALGVLLGAVARTPEQAQSIAIPVGIAMGMLGGALWPLELVPDWLRQVGHLTPHAWAMDGWITVVFRDGGLTDIALELAVLLAFGAAAAALGARALRRAISSGR
jgi:ABC-2 type transport system permease protein